MLKNPGWNRLVVNTSKLILAFVLAAPAVSLAQNLTIYADSLVNGWGNGSYNVTLNYANTSPVHSGSASISATITAAYGGIQLNHASMTNTAYSSISFWLHGGASGGQRLQMYANLSTGTQAARYSLNAPLAGTWQQYTIPLAALGAANVTNFTGFAIQDSAGSTEPTFYVDDIQLVNAAGPALTHLTVNAGQSVRTADARWFGLNTPNWDSVVDTPQTMNLLTNMGVQAIRIPGGSESDEYHWLYNRSFNNNWTWATSLAKFIHVITNLNAQAMTTVNYGTGYSNEAAAWVAYVNAPTNSTQPLGVDASGFNWQTAGYWASLRAAAPLGSDDGRNFLRLSRSAPLGFKYWEVGNENYGSWETDSNSLPHDPYTYGVRAAGYITLMKAVDPTIKIGVVVTPGEDSSANGYSSHPAFNSRTATSHNGWTPVVLATLKSLGVTPDFIVHHRYAQNPGGESDAGLLGSSTGWASDAANLRQMITDYVGSSGANIELVCTENNSVSSNPGKQSTSLVNGLFRADSLAQLMQTEFNGLFWWDLRNGQLTGNNNSASLYGWRQYGDYGIVDSGFVNLYPNYYTAKLMTNFVQAGDTVVGAGSDYSLLSTYAVRRQNGTLTILTINKDPVNTLTGQVAVAGFTPLASGGIFSYGIPQDTAAQTGTGSPDVAQAAFSVSGTNFNYSFPPYSATVLVLSPATLPQITSLTAGTNFIYGNSVTLTAGATGTGPLAYQWYDNKTNSIAGQTNASLTLTVPSVTNSGNYTLVITNAYGRATNFTTVTVNPLPVQLTGSRAYDGTTTAAFGILSVANKVGADAVNVATGGGLLSDANVGVKAFTSFGTLALSGPRATNYTLVGAGGTVTITNQPLTITANNRTNECGTAPVFAGTEFTTSGLVSPDTVTSVSLNNVGASILAANAVGSGLANYAITYVAGTLTTVDTTPPVITVLGANPLTNAVNLPFVDPGATALDACAGSVAVGANNPVNVSVPGSYTVTYTADDGNGNTNTATRTVVVNPVAQTNIVTTLADSGAGSLRQVILDSPAGSTVLFDPGLAGQTILLTSGELLLTNSLNIDASALANGIAIDGNQNGRIFEVASNITVTLAALTITNGNDSSGIGGGGICNNGTLTVNHCTLAGNTSTGAGGAIGNFGILTNNQCGILGNTAASGGGIYNASVLTVNQSTISGNTTTYGSGGGINSDLGSTLTVNGSTLSGNTCTGPEGWYGGGINVGRCTATVNQSTVAGNSCIIGGGGIWMWGTVQVNQCTVVSNTVTGNYSASWQGGGGICYYLGTLTLNNSIVAGNSAITATDLQAANASPTYLGTNLISVDPLLAPLGNYGGLTPTLPPLTNSPAIDAGSDTATNSFVTDQRGLPRKSGAHVDIGAVEYQVPVIVAANPPVLTGLTRSGNGTFGFNFTSLAGASFTVFASTNVALPMNAWSNLGPAVELPSGSGQFQFADPQATNNVRRFYRVHSP